MSAQEIRHGVAEGLIAPRVDPREVDRWPFVHRWVPQSDWVGKEPAL